jgi:glycosyltransferase involved in cell wall biosynthesis
MTSSDPRIAVTMHCVFSRSLSVECRGPVQNARPVSELLGCDLCFGENFRHAILEALSACCPVLVSDQAPWRSLADRKAEWDLPLTDPGAFRRVLSACVEMDAREQERRAAGARRAAEQYLPASILETIVMFQRLAEIHTST